MLLTEWEAGIRHGKVPESPWCVLPWPARAGVGGALKHTLGSLALPWGEAGVGVTQNRRGQNPKGAEHTAKPTLF